MPLSQVHRDLIAIGDKLHSDRSGILSLWQEIADNFYVERANFTASRNLGDDFAGHLTTSYPMIARRDLGNAFSAMLRPTEKHWYHVTTREPQGLKDDGRKWLEYAAGVMRSAMYAKPAQFNRATKEGDHDFAAFGQCVISVELVTDPYTGVDLLYRCHHLKDVAWMENERGIIDHVDKKCKYTARTLMEKFPGRVHANVVKCVEKGKEPLKEFNVRHIVVPAQFYQGDRKTNLPYVSIYIDTDNQHLMEEVPRYSCTYIIPRWQTVSGSQYAHSPATVAALPDARLIQEINLTLINAGQMAVHPPLVATKEAVKGDIPYFAGGVIWAEKEYDERSGDAIRVLDLGTKNGMPIGIDMGDRVRLMIAEAFFLNKLNMPQRGPEMTAYEVGQRVQEYIRNALPLFEPMEMEYNGAICEHTFDLLFRAGAFGSPYDIPRSLRGADLTFRFESPLHDALESEKAQKFLETKALLAEAAVLDPLLPRIIKPEESLRDALRGIGTPAKWINDELEMVQIRTDDARAKAQAAATAQIAEGAVVAEQVGLAGKELGAAAQALSQPIPQQQRAA